MADICGRVFRVRLNCTSNSGTPASVAQGIERLPPEQKATGSIPVGGTTLFRHMSLPFTRPAVRINLNQNTTATLL